MSISQKLLPLFALTLALYGQTERGTITGTLTDPAGAVIAGAPLNLINTDTGTPYQAATTDTGNYTFGQLPVGTYQITATVAGFKTYVHQNLRVQAAQTIREDIVLEVGTAAESVTVTAEASMLKTESAELATNVTTARLNSLPILGVGAQTSSSHGVRNPLAASQLQNGVRFVANSVMRVNGAPNNTMAIKLDGQDITNNTAGASFQAQVQPSVDAVEEVAIQTSNYAAEFGQAGGGLFNFTTKSGTNAYHGALFDYFVNEALWAAQPYNKIKPEQRRQNYGGSIGGPIRIPKIYDGKDRSFFFFNYEDFRENIMVNTVLTTVPIQAYRDGNFSSVLTGRTIPSITNDGLGNPIREGMIFDPNTERLAANGTRARLQFAGNAIPVSRFDPSAVKMQNLMPAPNYAGGALVNNFNSPYASNRKTPIPGLKLDHSLNDRMKASFYWSTNETQVPRCAQQCGSNGLPVPIDPTRGTYIESYTLRANFDYTLRPTVLLHIGAGVLSNDFKDFSTTIGYDMQKELGISGGLAGGIGRFPQVTGLTMAQGFGGMSQLGPGGQARNRFLKPTGNISMSWVTGNHTYKFGGELRLEGYPTAAYTSMNGTFAFAQDQTSNPFLVGAALGGRFVGNPYASFLLGKVDTVTIGPPAIGRGGRAFYSWFTQDTWKLTRKLTLDYGLRWDLFTYSKEQYGRAPSFSSSVANPAAGNHPGAAIFEATCNCSFGNNYKHAYQPRVGIAYQIDSKTVLRAGAGISYSMSPGHLGQTGSGQGRTQTLENPNFADSAMVLSQGIPIQPVWPTLTPSLFPSPGVIASNNQLSAVDQNFGRPARMWQYSISLQREIGNDLVLEASYVGNRGVWWMTGTLSQPNLLDPGILSKTYGLDWTNAADRTMLAAQVGSAAAGRFRNKIPYAGFPTSSSVAQSLRPFPQFSNLGVTGAPMGKTWYDSFQFKATKRVSRGLDFTFNYTFSKELQLGAESDTGGGIINDILNRNTNKQLSGSSRPHYMVFATNYTVQKYFGNRAMNMVLADWMVGAVLQYGSGLPIAAPATISNNNTSTLLRGTYATRVPGAPLYNVDINCGCFDYGQTIILNRDAWVDTPSGQFSPSAAYYNDFRYQRRPQELVSLARNFRIKERVTFMIRAEFNNIFNRVLNMNSATPANVDMSTALGANYTRNPAGIYTAGFGTLNTSGNIGGQRQGTLVARLTF